MSASSVIRNSRILVHFFSDTMTFQFSYYGETERFSIRLYRVSDIASSVSVDCLLNSFVQRSFCNIEELAGLCVHFTYRESIARITVIALVQSSDITGNDVSLFKDVV